MEKRSYALNFVSSLLRIKLFFLLDDYATLDEVSISLAGPSSTDPLLTDRKSLLHASHSHAY